MFGKMSTFFFFFFFCLVSQTSQDKPVGVMDYLFLEWKCLDENIFIKTWSLTNMCRVPAWDAVASARFTYIKEKDEIFTEEYDDRTCARIVSSSYDKVGVCYNYTSEFGDLSGKKDYVPLSRKKNEYFKYMFNSKDCDPSTIEIVSFFDSTKCTYIGGGRRVIGRCLEDNRVELKVYYTEGCTGDPPHVEINECHQIGAFTFWYNCGDLTV